MTYPLRIKICGVTNEADALQAARLGADAVGLNFYAASPRCVARETAARILRELPPFVDPVGLFVERPWSQIVQELEPLGRIRTIQWHGTNPETRDPSPYRFLPAFPVRDMHSLREITGYLDQCREQGYLPAAVLLDAYVPGQHGGTGHTVPWDLLADFQPGVPLVLAGGLTPENVAEAVHIVRPYAVDVASGVESSPGRKDPEKLRRFFANARDAAARAAER